MENMEFFCGEKILLYDVEKQIKKALFYLQEEGWRYSFWKQRRFNKQTKDSNFKSYFIDFEWKIKK